MKKILCLAAALSVLAPAAFGQADSENGNSFGPRARDNDFSKTNLILVSAGESPEAVSVAKEIRRAMERSRRLEPVYVDDDRGARLAAPIAVEKDASGQNITVTYEQRTARRYTETNKVTCPVAKPANCARDIVVAAEKFVRVNKDR